LAAAAERVAVDGGDRRLRELLDRAQGVEGFAHVGTAIAGIDQLAEAFDVAPDREAAPGAAEDQRPDLRVRLGGRQHLLQVGPERARHRVELVGAVEQGGREAALDRVADHPEAPLFDGAVRPRETGPSDRADAIERARPGEISRRSGLAPKPKVMYQTTDR